jgi:hypothetical protein
LHETFLLKPTTDFDQRFSIINKEDNNIWGFRVDVIVIDKFKVPIGGAIFLSNILSDSKARKQSKKLL